MKIYHLVLCCVLFTAALSFSPVDATSERASGSLPLETSNQNCRCEDGKCVTDKLGNTKCACRPGYALQGEFTCKPCDCGSSGSCIFVLKLEQNEQPQYKKECVCDKGKAEKDGICIDCDCGKHSACDYVFGDKRCYCIAGYSEKDGVCTECDCGSNGDCKFENGNKKCDCYEGFLELNGKCEGCDCGEHGTCLFVNGQKTCQCEKGFSANDGKCETCDCGTNSENCAFVDGVKRCKCNDRYADRYGTCEECYCGNYATSCSFNNNQKTCSCLEGYVQKGETCQLGCSTQNPCQNGGYCKEGFCFCLKGTRGEFCEVIGECSKLCPKRRDVECAYDIVSQKPFCRCLIGNNLNYDPNKKQCRKDCVDDSECLNGGKCGGEGAKMFCNCLPGTQGDRCEIVDDCVSGRIKCKGKSRVKCNGETEIDAYCGFDVNTRKATCKCKDDMEYDFKHEMCRYVCKKQSDCLNGGKCLKGGYCWCQPGTHGGRCEIVDDCCSGRVKCKGSGAYCTYDANKKEGTCKCKDSKEYYDFWDQKCKRCTKC